MNFMVTEPAVDFNPMWPNYSFLGVEASLTKEYVVTASLYIYCTFCNNIGTKDTKNAQ